MSKMILNEFQQPIGHPVPNWQPARSPVGDDLAGHYCRLEPLDFTRHGQELFDSLVSASPRQQWTYLAYGPFDDRSSFFSWLNSVAGGTDPFFYAVVPQTERQARASGLASVMRMNREHGSIEIGHIHFAQELQRTAPATESLYLLIKSSFEELGYRRLEWKCDSLNESSRNAALRLGFQFEGIFRQASIYKGRNRDTAWFSITHLEWPRIRDGMERWLDVENFNACGQQIARLQDLMPPREPLTH